MAIVVTGADWVRIASGLLMLALGGGLLVARWSLPRAHSTGLALVGIGIFGATTNFSSDDMRLMIASDAAGAAGAAVGAAGLCLFLSTERGPRVAMWAAAAAIVLGIVVLFARVLGAPGGDTFGRSGLPVAAWPYYSLQIAYGVLGLLTLSLSRRSRMSTGQARGDVLLALGLAAWPIYLLTLIVSGGYASPWGELRLFIAAGLVSACVLAWARASAAMSLAVALGSTGFLLLDIWAARSGIDLGMHGIARMLGLGIIAYAIFRHDALGAGFRPKTMSRATAATLFLAALFIVAQIAQNFLSAQYGLLMGGVVAGALLVAARPIERALDRRTPEPARASGDATARERSFLAAARKFHRDGVISREEERELVILAEHLGITASRAYELRDTVERERP